MMRRMNELKKEKEDLMRQVDVEEDHIANTLLKRLDTVVALITCHPLVTERKGFVRTEAGIRARVHGEPSSAADPSDSQREDVRFVVTGSFIGNFVVVFATIHKCSFGQFSRASTSFKWHVARRLHPPSSPFDDLE